MKVHSQLLRHQIQNREQERIEERKAFFEESDNLTAEQEEHERKIQKVRFKFYKGRFFFTDSNFSNF